MKRWTHVLAALFLASAAFAEDLPTEDIVVHAQAESVPEQQAPTAFVTSIDTEQHAEQFETVTDALAESVGVQVRRYGGLGAFSTVSIRGSSPNQVQIYFDGIPISRARNETVNLADLPLDSLQRIDIYRGTVPLDFGVAGIGGVVNLVPKKPTDEPSSEVSASYGSFNTRKVVTSHSQRVGGFGVLAHATYLGSDGDFTFFNFDPTLRPAPGGPHQTRVNNAFNSVYGLFEVERDIGRTSLALVSELFFKDQGLPGRGSPQFIHASFSEIRSTSYLRLTRNDLAGGHVDVFATLYGGHLNERFKDPVPEFGGGRQDRDDVTTQVGGNFHGTWRAPLNNDVSWFSEVSDERFDGSNADARDPNNRSDPQQQRMRAAAGVQDQLRLFSDRVVLVPTLHYEQVDDQGTDFDILGRVAGPASQAHSLWNPAIGAQAALTPWFDLRGNIGRANRVPSFSDRFGNRGATVGNPDLKPEDGILRDVGFRLRSPFDWLDARIEYAYFNNDLENVIVIVPTAGIHAVQARNVGAARIRGHELVLTSKPLRWLEVDMNYTHQDTENRSQPYAGSALPGRPEDELYARLQIGRDWWKTYYEIDYIGRTFFSESNLEQPIESRLIFTSGFKLDVTKWLSVGFEARNLGNDRAEDIARYPLPGRSFFGTVQAKI